MMTRRRQPPLACGCGIGSMSPTLLGSNGPTATGAFESLEAGPSQVPVKRPGPDLESWPRLVLSGASLPCTCRKELVPLDGLEPPTRGLGNRCSVHLSYRGMVSVQVYGALYGCSSTGYRAALDPGHRHFFRFSSTLTQACSSL